PAVVQHAAELAHRRDRRVELPRVLPGLAQEQGWRVTRGHGRDDLSHLCPPRLLGRFRESLEEWASPTLQAIPDYIYQCMVAPPSTTSVWPVTKSLSSDAKKITAPTRSAGSCTRGSARASIRAERMRMISSLGFSSL